MRHVQQQTQHDQQLKIYVNNSFSKPTPTSNNHSTPLVGPWAINIPSRLWNNSTPIATLATSLTKNAPQRQQHPFRYKSGTVRAGAPKPFFSTWSNKPPHFHHCFLETTTTFFSSSTTRTSNAALSLPLINPSRVNRQLLLR